MAATRPVSIRRCPVFSCFSAAGREEKKSRGRTGKLLPHPSVSSTERPSPPTRLSPPPPTCPAPTSDHPADIALSFPIGAIPLFVNHEACSTALTDCHVRKPPRDDRSTDWEDPLEPGLSFETEYSDRGEKTMREKKYQPRIPRSYPEAASG
ncbi:hypothetical protein KM043_002152 [Ampulex compressa]|nr:hypothetical protein KM043_002152 [Ampulex compressa]